MTPVEDKYQSAANPEFKQKWGTPLARPGNAVDYAQCIFGLITVRTHIVVHTRMID